jgi:hypothetical protein
MTRIAAIVGDRFNSQTVWRMYFDYAIPRFFGRTQEEIIGRGNCLNYGVTWDGTERVFATPSNEPALTSQVAELDRSLSKISQEISESLTADGAA